VKEQEKFKVFKEVFDEPTMKAISKLASDGYIDYMLGVISTGKEANVYLVKTPDNKSLAAKIYRIETSAFENMWKYVKGDYRFENAKLDKRNIVLIWAKKEFKNLQLAENAGVRVPKPIICRRNILLMEFIGEGEIAAPTAKNCPPENLDEWMKTILENIKKLYQRAGIVHSDLSEYNILNYDGEPVIIDIGQAVVKEHPQADEFLRKDIQNVLNWFKKLGVTTPLVDKVYKEIVGKVGNGRV
jgi:RIO kinase 1